MKQFKMHIQGMTCTGCENHIEKSLKKIGAENIKVDFHRNEAVFELAENRAVEEAIKAVKETNYQPGEVVEVPSQKRTVSNSQKDYDLLIVGSGSAAFSAAIKAVELGAKVGMIERGIVGGTCVNVGCIPSKTLLRAGEINQSAHMNPFDGLHTSAKEVTLNDLINQKNELVGQLRNQKYIDLIEVHGFDLIKGEAKFINESTIEVAGKTFSAQRFLIATGASPLLPDIPGLEEVDYLTSKSLLGGWPASERGTDLRKDLHLRAG